MHLHDLINRSDLERGIADKLITVREAHDGQRIYNYSDAALYTDGAWDNPAVRQCRGLIVRPDNTIAARPWVKFFNHGQVEAGELDLMTPVEVTDKMDGSLGIIHLDEAGAQRVATRGSFESDQAIHATALLNARYPALTCLVDVTPLVEIIYPVNRIVCDYGDLDDLVLLGGVNVEDGEYMGPVETAHVIGWSGPRTEVFPYRSLRDALAAEPRPGKEGLCVRYLNEPRIVKVKQEEYVRLHRIVTGLSERTVWEHMREGKPLDDLLEPLPDELHQWTRDVWATLEDDLDDIHNTASLTHCEILDALGDDWTRKDYALAAQSHPTVRPYLFMILDGRDPRPSILRILKPAGDTRAKAISEAVA